MKLNHINLPVADVAESRAFFEEYFGFTCLEVKGNNLLAILKGTDGFILVLSSPALNRNGNHTYPDSFHFGFLVETAEEVNAVYEKLNKGGVKLGQDPGSIRGGYGFYFNAPGNILTEVSTL